jgi:hypothetical protein
VKTLRLGSDCENVYSKDHSKTLRHNMEMALIKLQTGSDAVIVSIMLTKNVKLC